MLFHPERPLLTWQNERKEKKAEKDKKSNLLVNEGETKSVSALHEGKGEENKRLM